MTYNIIYDTILAMENISMNDPMKFAQSYTIDLATIARLSELQDATGLTRSALVRDAIAHYHEWYFNGRISDTKPETE